MAVPPTRTPSQPAARLPPTVNRPISASDTADTLAGNPHIKRGAELRSDYINEGGIRQITRDHSVVQELIETGQITEEEARSHPRRNFITRALGVRCDESGEYDELDLEAGDRLLLCTDGLTNEVDTADIRALLEQPAEQALPALVRAALDGGGADNITVVVMDID